jgi:hypothetical protein
MKQSFVHQLAGQPDLAKKDLSWIKHGKKGPKGPFSRIFKMSRKPHKAISALMVYTAFLAPHPTRKQLDKFYHAAETADVRVSYSKTPFIEGLNKYKDRFTDLNTFLEKSTKIPIFHEDKKKRWPFKTVSTGFAMDCYVHGDDREEYLRSGPVSYDNVSDSAFTPLIEDWFNQNHDSLPDEMYKIISRGAMTPSSDEFEYVGLISHIQEPGYKLRVVANPLPVYQLALSRMGNKLYDWLGDRQSDCTFDQERGIKEIQQRMIEGDRLVSIDLSNATDSFPLEVTMRCLRKTSVFEESDLQLFEKVARGKYFDPMNEKGYTQWTKGQPLGVYPSFAAFAYTHHLVVADLFPKFYRILGDDIVIDRETGIKLLETYKQLGVKISKDKSLDSPLLNEFGGRLITKDRIIAQPKWRDLSDHSFLDVVRNLGPTAVGLLKPRQRKVVRAFSEVPRDAHPFGMGWNPSGKTYNQRLEENAELIATIKFPTHTYSSKTARSLGDLKTQIRYRQKGDFHIDTEPPEAYHRIDDIESLILLNAGVTRADVAKEEFTDWTLKSSLTSDPRGISTLQVAERQIRDAVSTKAPSRSK